MKILFPDSHDTATSVERRLPTVEAHPLFLEPIAAQLARPASLVG